MPLSRSEKIGLGGIVLGLSIGAIYQVTQHAAIKEVSEGDFNTWAVVTEVPVQGGALPTDMVIDNKGNIYVFSQGAVQIVRPSGDVEQLDAATLGQTSSFEALSTFSAFQTYMVLPSSQDPGSVDLFKNGKYLLTLSTGYGNTTVRASIDPTGKYIALATPDVIQLWSGSKTASLE